MSTQECIIEGGERRPNQQNTHNIMGVFMLAFKSQKDIENSLWYMAQKEYEYFELLNADMI